MEIYFLRQIAMISKWSLYGMIVQMIFTGLILASDGQAQSVKSVREKQISIEFKNSTLSEVFSKIERKTGYHFAYEKREISKKIKINAKYENVAVSDILLHISDKAGLKFKQINKSIIVSEKETEDSVNDNLEIVIQGITITGKVSSSIGGEALPGVNVTIKGTSTGTITDVEGNYELEVPDKNTVLIFSYVGYKTTEVIVGNRTIIDVSMTPDVTALDEIVVIGYGEQKKVNLTGAVADVDGEEIVKRPVNNVATLLQGKLTGVRVNQGSAQPGKENTYIRIRGIGTFSRAGNNPLVIVDGIAGSLDNVDPENIESVSVLKDAASSAIYGARAANGVIVVTTKEGKAGKISITYHYNFARQSATILPDFIWNSVEYMEMWNYAHERQGLPNKFDQSIIDSYRNASPDDPQYPNYNWLDFSFRTVSVQRHNLNIMGGNGKSQYYANFSYYDQPAIVIGHNYKKYQGQLKFDTKINNFISFGANISLTAGKRKEPWIYDSGIILQAYGQQPMYTPYLADGSGRYSHGAWPDKWVNRNPAFVANEGGRYFDHQNVRAISYLKFNILPELTWQVTGAIDYSTSFLKIHNYPVQTYSFATGEPYSNGWPTNLGVSDNYGFSNMPTLFSTLDYNKIFKESHHVKALIGYNQEYFFGRNLSGYRKDFSFPQLKQLNAGGTEGQSTSGTAYEWAIQSFFGRITYDYKGKYLFEANARYDGTSRIAKDNRWGLFPSFSAGWRISDESFLSNLLWLDDLKIRASWGQLGNQNIGVYPYQDVLSLTHYPAGATLDQGVVQNRLTDKNLKWETTTTTDIGVDMTLANGLFSLVFDWYNKNTEGILYPAQIPGSVGLGAPIINYASMENNGIEFLVGHKNRIGEFTYSIDLNFSKNNNKVTKVRAPSYGRNSTVEGMPINSYYMIEWDGIFQSQAEIDEAPEHPGSPQPGDLRFKDANGDGVINSDDRVFVDGAHPDFIYGGNINLQWKNWDLSMFFQGVQGQKQYLTWWVFWPFTQGTPPTTDWRNAWTPENKSETMPALWTFDTYGYTPMSGTTNTFDLHDASYLRLKNLYIGYNIPKSICNKIKMREARIYFSADNLLTWTKMKHVDPERVDDQWWSTRGSVYPQAKTISFGIKVTF